MTEGITFHIHPGQWNQLVNDPHGDIGRHVEKQAQKLRILAVRQVGKDTGSLAASIKVHLRPTPNGPMAVIGSDHSIALLHHNGTRPHVIAPRTGRVLRFSHRGKVVYARKVMHPGTRPNRYLSDNLRRVVVD